MPVFITAIKRKWINSWPIYVCIYTTSLPQKKDVTQGQFLNRVNQVWIQFSFLTDCLTKAKKIQSTIQLPIAGERIDEFMPISRAYVWSEMKIASSRTWTQVTNSISYNDNRYT